PHGSRARGVTSCAAPSACPRWPPEPPRFVSVRSETPPHPQTGVRGRLVEPPGGGHHHPTAAPIPTRSHTSGYAPAAAITLPEIRSIGSASPVRLSLHSALSISRIATSPPLSPRTR